MMALKQSLVVLCVALIFASCSKDECNKDGDCADTQYCLNGSCLNKCPGPQCDQLNGTCQNSDNCVAPQVCFEGICTNPEDVTQPPSCTTNDDCYLEKLCDLSKHKCVTCIITEHCPNPEDECLPSGECGQANTCERDLDCSATQQYCYTSLSGGYCVDCYEKEHCSNDEICDLDTYTCQDPQVDGCTQTECNVTGKICDAITGLCRDCDGNSECSGGLVCLTGTCSPCTDTNQCTEPQECDLDATPAVCKTPGSTDKLSLGEACTQNAQCEDGLCLSVTSNFCTRPCIGSGKGYLELNGHEKADCPSGFRCHVGAHGTVFDGLRFCIPGEQVDTLDGYPYTSPPGGNCSSSNNSCQTGLCLASSNTCARLCVADKDCNSNEVCWTVSDLESDDESLGTSYCWPADSGLETGSDCSSNYACDSGKCMGLCYALGTPVAASCTTTKQCADAYGADYICSEYCPQGGCSGQCHQITINQTANLCTNHADCPTGYGCLGTCVDGCRSHDDCTTPGQGCFSFPLDPVGAPANPEWNGDMWTTVCSDMLFHDPPNTTCDDDLECRSQDCGVDGYCQTPTVNKVNGEACSLPSECQSEYCEFGICTAPCFIDADCVGNAAGPSCIIAEMSDGSNILYQMGLCGTR